MPATHDVFNQPPPLAGYDVADDQAMLNALGREGAGWAEDAIRDLGRLAGSAHAQEQGRQANEHPPVLRTHDRFGHRIDEVEFHPAWHELMTVAVRHGLHAAPWRDPRPGAHVARAAGFYVWGAAEAGHLCPVSMTYAIVPALRNAPALAGRFICEDGLVHYCSQQRGYPAVPLEHYSVADIRREFSRKRVAPHTAPFRACIRCRIWISGERPNPPDSAVVRWIPARWCRSNKPVLPGCAAERLPIACHPLVDVVFASPRFPFQKCHFHLLFVWRKRRKFHQSAVGGLGSVADRSPGRPVLRSDSGDDHPDVRGVARRRADSELLCWRTRRLRKRTWAELWNHLRKRCAGRHFKRGRRHGEFQREPKR